MGAWRTVPQRTVDDPAALGMALDQTIAALRKVDDILATANYAIHRQCHVNSSAA